MAYEKQPYEGLDFVTSNNFFEEDDFSSAIDVDPADDSFFAADSDDSFYEDDFAEEDVEDELFSDFRYVTTSHRCRSGNPAQEGIPLSLSPRVMYQKIAPSGVF